MTFLPIETLRSQFAAAFARGPVVVTAPTGTGKSTCVPVWCAEAGRVLVVEPRRVACRSLARFVAQQRGGAVGEWVGYAHRHEERLGPETQIAYVTPGVALRLLAEGEVGRYDVIIVDEFHERTVENDLVLALALDRAEQRLVVMSATLAGEEVARYLGGEWLQAPGEMYPVTVEYEGPTFSRRGGRSLLPTGWDLDRRVAAALDRVEDRPGDVLVFLPGKGEIQACYQLLQNRRSWEVLRLHGELPPEEQDRAFTVGTRRRVILATNVAETSVTLPNIGVVIDSGLVRQKQYRQGREVLALGPIAWDSAEQRRGRAGRVRPGHCLRLWDAEARLEERTLPEIHRSSLAHFVLMVASCGRRVEELRFLDPPKGYAVRAAEEELQRLGALDAERQITPLGRRLARLPLDPFHGALLLAAQEVGGLQEMVDLVASLAQGRPLFRTPSPADREAVWQARAPLRAGQCDGTARILALRRGDPESQALHREAWEEGRRIAQQLRELFHLPPCRTAEFDRSPLLRAILKADPTTAFVPRRRRRGAWGNGQQEVTLGSDSFARPDAPALLVLETHSVEQKGSRPVHFATCALPCPLETLVQAGVGTVELGALKWDGETLWGTVRIVHGGRELLEEEQELEGPLAVEGIVRLAMEGRLLPEETAALREEIELWNLKQQLESQGRPAPTVDPQEWLRERLTALGVQRGSDLALLLPEDLRFPGVTEEERHDLNRRFPRHLSLGGLIADVEYDVPRRTVTLIKRKGSAQDRPNLQFLPSWPGWRVLFRDHQRVTVLRE